MKRFLFTGFLLVLLTVPTTAQASFISTFDFDGFFHYTGAGDLEPVETFCSEGIEAPFIDCGDPSEDSFFGLGALVWDHDINLPTEDEPFPWWFEYEVGIEGFFMDSETTVPVSEGDSDSVNLGTFVFTEEDLALLLADLESELGGLTVGTVSEEFGDPLHGGLLFGFDENILDFDDDEKIWLAFNIDATLTGHKEPVIPEPSSLVLLGTGVLGAFGYKRKRKTNIQS